MAAALIPVNPALRPIMRGGFARLAFGGQGGWAAFYPGLHPIIPRPVSTKTVVSAGARFS
jgi:hypothetical protein